MSSLTDDGCEVIRDRVTLSAPPFKTRYFAPANLRAAAEDEAYLSLINYYISEKYTLRYSGGLVPDVLHVLVKGHGIYISPVTKVSQAKLRRLFELAPIALIMECAGARAIDPATGKYRAIPLEVLVKGDPAPTYGITLEDAGRYRAQPVLPFSAYGALAMARPESEPDGGSSQFFFFLNIGKLYFFHIQFSHII